MYIKKLVYENVGPIERVDIDTSYTKEGNPKPILLVGENGSGKSTILSNIVDAFYEIAGLSFENARYSYGNNTYQYYKAIRPADIHIGQKNMFSCVEFQDEGNTFTYLLKSGSASKDIVQDKLNGISLSNLSWKEDNNYKGININNDKAKKIFIENVICYFGPDRYEKPAWLGERYYMQDEQLHLNIHEKSDGKLYNHITVKNITSTNLQWLLDLIADSRSDIVKKNDYLATTHVNLDSLILLGAARKNLETLMSNILGVDIYFSLNFRNEGGSRFKIIREKDDTIFAPSLDALSTGQIALFNTFATIIRYADNNDINKSIYLDQIKGIVVIDEIELHLHTRLQKEVLPKLIKLFPKVQFVITTHAPLFLLGMAETFGEDGFDVYEMPTANKITVERFTEFQKAFEYLQKTQSYQSKIAEAVKSASNNKKALVITEGSTDWKHMKAAYESLKDDSSYSDIFKGLDFDFLEYEPQNSTDDAKYKLEMGNKALEAMCESCSKLPQSTKLIFIADRDIKSTNKKLMDIDCDFKSWGNGVYSFIIPIPEHREKNPLICIEHLYSDAEIKTEYTEHTEQGKSISRRLYMGNEFDSRGIASAINKFCNNRNACGTESIAIIDDDVTNIFDDNDINYALPKAKFASLILSKTEPFGKFNFKNFLPIFKTIKEIIEN